MEQDAILKMSQSELNMKKLWEKMGPEYFGRPIPYDEFISFDDSVQELYQAMRKHQSKSVNIRHQHTAGAIGDDPDVDFVEIVSHTRYSLPVMHNHEYIELIYVYSGKCLHFVKNQTFEMKAGDLCILAPNAIHALSACSEDDIIINIMMSQKLFDGAFLKMMQRGATISGFFESILYERKASPYILYSTGDDNWVRSTVVHMVEERKKKDYLYNESISLLVKQLFIHILRYYEMMAVVSDPINNIQENKIVSLMGYISVNYRSITLSDTADFFGYSKAYLSQILSKYTGKSFTTLVNEEKMKNAAKLLEETRLSLTEIGEEVGCYDASHFTHKFKNIYGVTPKEYRLRVKSTQE